MDARLLTRGTNLLLVAVVGMGAGHLIMPARPGAGAGARAAFVALVAGSGAVAGARERAIAREYGTRTFAARWPWLVAGAVVALLLAGVAWYMVHG